VGGTISRRPLRESRLFKAAVIVTAIELSLFVVPVLLAKFL
jgi:hypothetical protein